jgi:hypothetical protein
VESGFSVNGMLPDFRFVLGAVLAIALLAVAGLGLVTSVQLVHEARINPLEDARSLAFAGHAEWNQFYDPDGARRFEGLVGKPEAPVAPAALETPAEIAAPPAITPPAITPPTITQSVPEERTASIPADRLDPDIAPVVADDKAPDKTLQIDPPHVDPPQSAEPPATVTIAAPPAERVASAPATLPAPERTQAEAPPSVPEPTHPQASGDPQGSAPPTPRVRPHVQFHRKIAHAHVRSVAPANQQSWPNSGFSNAPWPGYDDPITGATTKKNAGRLSGTLSNRPQ